jgi:DNA-binding NarL/FixJ family response regulator
MRQVSPRLAEVLILRQAGFTEREVAKELGLSIGTVKTYSHALRAMGWRFERRNAFGH